jgi:hypothetical protein
MRLRAPGQINSMGRCTNSFATAHSTPEISLTALLCHPSGKTNSERHFGGPIKRQKTIFFFDYEGIRQSLGVTAVSVVPSPQARPGHLVSGAVTVDPLVLPYLSFFPLPNGPISGDAGTFSLVTQNLTTESFATARGDHRFSDKDSLHMTWLFDNGQTSGPDVFGGLLPGTLHSAGRRPLRRVTYSRPPPLTSFGLD